MPPPLSLSKTWARTRYPSPPPGRASGPNYFLHHRREIETRHDRVAERFDRSIIGRMRPPAYGCPGIFQEYYHA